MIFLQPPLVKLIDWLLSTSSLDFNTPFVTGMVIDDLILGKCMQGAERLCASDQEEITIKAHTQRIFYSAELGLFYVLLGWSGDKNFTVFLRVCGGEKKSRVLV